ncbi:MAG: tripartite tricarboxylate transporter TctB family protein [Rhodobacteraceae bacterium]|jgi:putative tricarboxylic transport membrane protein|nr:MAG: tripartite tricarboxylate transporter TctB family protein [Paracoccaceae bacterium]|tara:strand:- start:6082 stop:6564 length:483 start_codon:yes stop_codon:yes gene_type:complete
MSLDRWIALILLGFCVVYGYTAWFTMDATLAPFMKRNPIWPSTFPKILSILGILLSSIILLGFERNVSNTTGIDYRRLHEYKLGQAVLLLLLMVLYALLLRPVGFIFSTSLFLIFGSVILGERKWFLMLPIAIISTLFVWYLVQVVLGIYMRPLPAWIGI